MVLLDQYWIYADCDIKNNIYDGHSKWFRNFLVTFYYHHLGTNLLNRSQSIIYQNPHFIPRSYLLKRTMMVHFLYQSMFTISLRVCFDILCVIKMVIFEAHFDLGEWPAFGDINSVSKINNFYMQISVNYKRTRFYTLSLLRHRVNL